MERKLWNGLLLGVATTCCCNRYPRKTESSCVTFGMWKSTTRTKHTLSTPNSSNRSFNSSSSGLWVEPSRRCVYVLRLVGRSDGRLHDCSLARIQADRLLVRYIKKNHTRKCFAMCIFLWVLWRARETHCDCFRMFLSTVYKVHYTPNNNEYVPFKRPNKFMSMWFCCPYMPLYVPIQCINRWFDCIFN